MLNSPTIVVDICVSSFNSISLCFTYCVSLLLATYIFRIAVTSKWINILLLCIYLLLCPSLSLVIFSALKYTSSDINMAILAFFWLIFWLIFAWYKFFHPFILSVTMPLYLKWVSCKWQIVDSCYLNSLWQHLTSR